MSGATKYNFQDVLVADTRLLANMSADWHRPNILVLNNKLNKCPPHQPACPTCCLQREEPEFRRSSVPLESESERCFAQCSQRRALNIELTASLKLSGRLVILALSKLQDDATLQSERSGPLRCHTATTWSYVRFEPQTGDAASNRWVRFARLSRNQTPAMLIDSAVLERDHLSRRERLSLAVHANGKRLHQEVVSRETLLVTEMNCFSAHLSTNNIETRPMGKMHLLVLMNRDVSSPSSMSNSLKPAESIDTIASLTSVTDKGRRALTTVVAGGYESANQTTTKTAMATPMDEPMIDQRIDLPAYVKPSLSSDSKSSSAHDGLDYKPEFRLGPFQLTEFEAIRIRLKSSSLMMLAVSSSLIILTYTLCLLVYLKTRHKKSKSKTARPMQANGDSEEDRQHVVDISQPFNLQMPPETHSRLQIMLEKHEPLDAMSVNTKPPLGLTRAEMINQLGAHPNQGVNLRLQPVAALRRQQVYDPRVRNLYHKPNSYHDYIHKSSYQEHPSSSTYGTLSFVQALRQAASLARSGMRGYHYRSNLNVIPESDLEYLQSTHQGELELMASFLNQARPSGYQRSNHQLENLVQDAMSNECSHSQARFYGRNQTATLFSRPSQNDDDSADLVSRSRIVSQVKQDNSPGNYAKLVDTRI